MNAQNVSSPPFIFDKLSFNKIICLSYNIYIIVIMLN